MHGILRAEDYTYSTNNGAITITRYIGPGGAVTVPNTINGLPVVGIGNRAFAFATFGNETFTNANMMSITIPDSVTNMGIQMFYGCGNLVSVTLPNFITTIGQEEFVACQSLAEITIPNSVNSIEERAFDFCTGLTNVTIGNSVTNIGHEAFWYCTSLNSVTIPKA
jgi:hypothetical protein